MTYYVRCGSFFPYNGSRIGRLTPAARDSLRLRNLCAEGRTGKAVSTYCVRKAAIGMKHFLADRGRRRHFRGSEHFRRRSRRPAVKASGRAGHVEFPKDIFEEIGRKRIYRRGDSEGIRRTGTGRHRFLHPGRRTECENAGCRPYCRGKYERRSASDYRVRHRRTEETFSA